MPVMKADVKVGETIRFDGNGSISVTMIAKSGQRARLEIKADQEVSIKLPWQKPSLDAVKAGVKMS